MISAVVDEAIRTLLPFAGGREVRLEPLAGGQNNRVYRLSTPEREYAVKQYFRHPEERRDRLSAEFSFLSYAWGRGIRCVPEPIARDDRSGVALYGFCRGRPLTVADAGQAEVAEALAFVAAINQGDDPVRRLLGPASEACFTPEDHVAVVDRRVERLLGTELRDEVDAEANRFVRRELEPAWREVRARFVRSARDIPGSGCVTPAGRLVSPSDLGFHNALRREDGALTFVDFEYAGWDDPAKLVCDFFLQPRVPPPRACFDAFARGIACLIGCGDGFLTRVDQLQPVLTVKWCCIVLNHFSSMDRARRAFAAGSAAAERVGQLARARNLLGRITWNGEGQRNGVPGFHLDRPQEDHA